MRNPLYTTAGLLLAAALLGCGGGGNGGSEGGDASGASPQKAAGPVDKTVRMTGNDQLKFNRTEFTVAPGQRVKVVMRNIGQQPKSQAAHNWTLLKEGADLQGIGKTCAKKGNLENGYLPESVRDRVYATTRLLGPGEGDSVIFTAPEEPGSREFLCTFTGHFPTMQGKMLIRAKDEG